MNSLSCCDLSMLQQRAAVYRIIRDFFYERGVLEVEAPLLGEVISPDPFVNTLSVEIASSSFALQPSPEIYMKRLLSSGVTDCYYLGKAFRNDVPGKRHSLEFTLLEWYRLGLSVEQLIEEIKCLLTSLFSLTHFEHCTYDSLFYSTFGVGSNGLSDTVLIQLAHQFLDLSETMSAEIKKNPSVAFDLLFSSCIQPNIGLLAPLFVLDFPICNQVTLAAHKTRGAHQVEDRFELFYNGLEIANGYHELDDSQELETRLIANGMASMPGFQKLLNAQKHYFPACSGVALGVDRLLMAHFKLNDIRHVLSFPIHDMF